MISLAELFTFERAFAPRAAWHLSWRRRNATLAVRTTTPAEAAGRALSGAWLVPRPEICADAPDRYHPLYAAALVESGTFSNADAPPAQWQVPALTFQTDEWTRRSMTLNGMRMSTEFFQSGSERVLELLSNRLELGQRDIVGDVLVYQFRRVIDTRLEARETRLLRAESLAAYLGLERTRVDALVLAPRLDAAKLTMQLQSGVAGEIKRKLDLERLVAGQLRLLAPELARLRARERTAQHLTGLTAQLLSETA